MVNDVTGWSKILQYDNKHVIPTANLVETKCLVRYPRPTEITYDQGSECIGHEFRKSIIEEKYRILSKPRS